MNLTQAETLRALGFVHVTGLPKSNDVVIASPEESDWGRHDSNNSTQTVVTMDGQVWIRRATDSYIPDCDLRELAPNGRGAMVHCSNNERIDGDLLLARVADPGWKGLNGRYAW